jgi:hypothetical protein
LGRELRLVPPGWEHPKDDRGEYIPLLDQSYAAALADYEYAARLWAEGCHPSQLEWPERTAGLSYVEWDGGPPDPAHYRQEAWREDQATAWVLYENVTEGTPVSPPFASLDDLLGWMQDNGYSAAEVEEIKAYGALPTISAYSRGGDENLG